MRHDGAMSDAHPFRAAIEARDPEAAIALLHPDVQFSSPAVFKPYVGADVVGLVLRNVVEVLEDFHYTGEVSDGTRTVLFFSARVGDRTVEGIDDLVVDDSGRITHLRVMMRPLSGLTAVAEAMGRRLAQA
jgi:hypothetical protein